jgi:hypothetical protein
MKKDIPFYPVQGVQVAVVRNRTDLREDEWHVVLINRNSVPITNVFVTSKGYGSTESGTIAAQKTSTLRHVFAEIKAESYQTVEMIMPDVFHLCNEFWVSYFLENQIYDKKFIFVPGSIIDDHVIDIVPMGLEGVLHE